MATPGGYWRPRDPNRPMATPMAAVPAGTAPAPSPAALGLPLAPPPTQAPTETPEQRAARTGVNPGGQGAVSGQVAPGTGTSALAALGGATAPGAPVPDWRGGGAPAPAPGSGQGWRASVPAPAPNGWRSVAPGGGTATMTSGLTAGAPGTATTSSALTSGGANTGTQPGFSPLGPLAGPVNSIPIVGPLIGGLTTTSAVDLSPGLNAQRAAYGISDDLDRERFDYRPGDAPSMNIDSDIRQGQVTALGDLRKAATGAVPSVAELQSREAAGRAVAATLGQARALGGRSAGGAARAGTMASADILARTATEGAQLRAQEMERARAQEIAALQGVRGQDTDIGRANLGAQLDTNQLAEQHRMKLLEGRLQALGIGSQTIASILGAAKANADAENKAKGGIVGGLAALAGL